MHLVKIATDADAPQNWLLSRLQAFVLDACRLLRHRHFVVLFAALWLIGPLRAQPVSQAGVHHPTHGGTSHGHQLLSSADIPIPTGANYVLGLELGPDPTLAGARAPYLSTTGAVWGLFSIASSNFSTLFIASDHVEGLDVTSSVISDPLRPDSLLFSSFVAFAPAVTTIRPGPPYPATSYPIPDTTVVGLLAGDIYGALYVYCHGGGGIRKFEYQNLNFTSPVFVTAMSGPGAVTDVSHGFAVAHGVIYLLDPDKKMVFRYDANSGSYLGHFAVTGAKPASAIAVSNNGRLYLTTGDGGGNIYHAANGAPLGTFAARANANGGGIYNGGLDGIVIDELNAIVYAEDIATGFHVFHDVALHNH